MQLAAQDGDPERIEDQMPPVPVQERVGQQRVGPLRQEFPAGEHPEREGDFQPVTLLERQEGLGQMAQQHGAQQQLDAAGQLEGRAADAVWAAAAPGETGLGGQNSVSRCKGLRKGNLLCRNRNVGRQDGAVEGRVPPGRELAGLQAACCDTVL